MRNRYQIVSCAENYGGFSDRRSMGLFRATNLSKSGLRPFPFAAGMSCYAAP